VLGARPWSGEGPDKLEAQVGKPLVLPVWLVDRFGCVCSHEEPRVVRVELVGRTRGEVTVHDCCVVRGVGELMVVRSLAEEVACSIHEEDRVLDAAEDEQLAERIAAGSKDAPLLAFFTDTASVTFRHSDAVGLAVVCTVAAAKPPHTPNPHDTQPAAAPSATDAKQTDGAAAPDVTQPLTVVAGTKLEVVVQAVDAFGNAADSAVWWSRHKAPTVVLEEQALPKPEEQALTAMGTVGGSAMLPRTNGAVTHSVAPTPNGTLIHNTTVHLKNGVAHTSVKATVAGELRLSAMAKASSSAVPLVTGASSVLVHACAAEMFDLVPLDQGLGGMRLMVHARDAYGNLDEECEREVVIELEQASVPCRTASTSRTAVSSSCREASAS
jgi:hypothetical protein